MGNEKYIFIKGEFYQTMAMTNTFEFIGEARFGKEPVKEQEFNSGWTKRSIQLSIAESKNNSMFVTLEHGFYPNKQNDIFTFSKSMFGEKGSKLEVKWDDRFNDDTIRSVADFKKVVVDVTVDQEAKDKYYKLRNDIYKLESKEEPSDEDKEKLLELYAEVKETVPHRREFLSTSDAIDYLEKIADKLKGKKLKVKGNVEASYWNGNTYISYVAQSFEIVPDEEPNKLSANVELYFTKDSMDDKSFKKERKIYFDTYVTQYSRDHEKDVFYPYPTIFNAENHDDKNPSHLAHIDIVQDAFTVKNKKAVYKLPFQIRFVNGSEQLEATIDDLNDKQRRMVEAGFAEVKDFIKTTFGDRVSENRIYLPTLKDLGYNGNFSEGAIETDIDIDDLQYVPVTKEDKPKVEEKEENIGTETSFEDLELPF